MARKGPLLTLLGGGALAAALLVASINAASEESPDGDLVAGAGAPEPAPTGGALGTPSPEPTESPAPPEAGDEPVTYVGYVDGGDASVAIIVTGDEATAYVCDGSTVEAWLAGPARDGELALESENGELVGTFDAASATGETTVEEVSYTFTVDQVDAPEGLYQFASTVVGGAEVEGGWIILPDGTQVGVATVDGAPGPAPALDPVTGEVELAGRVVVAERVG